MLRIMSLAAFRRKWLRSINEVRCPVATVVCFPHSGGSAVSFASWAAAMPPDVALLGVQYPGRGDRFGEPPVGTVSEMSSYVAAELLALDLIPCALFGHSLGALVAYETAMLLRDRGRQPQQLFVSGCEAPGFAGGGTTHLASDEEFWQTVCELGGIEPEIALNNEMRDVLLPVIRSDIRASDTYSSVSDRSPLTCPVRCYHGDGDLVVDPARLVEWGGITTGPFTLCVRPGAHFHIDVESAELADEVVSALLGRTR